MTSSSSGELDRLPPEALVVNVGCGVVRRFEPVCTSHYLATDLRVLPNVDFSSDASSLPVADRSVDMVLALELLEHVPDPTAVLREIARVLKPGGRVIVSVPSTVPRHDDNDYWRFTAQGLEQLGLTSFDHVEVHVFGGTFEALGYLAEYYTSLDPARAPSPRAAPRAGVPFGRVLVGPPQRLVLVPHRVAHSGLRPALRRDRSLRTRTDRPRPPSGPRRPAARSTATATATAAPSPSRHRPRHRHRHRPDRT